VNGRDPGGLSECQGTLVLDGGVWRFLYGEGGGTLDGVGTSCPIPDDVMEKAFCAEVGGSWYSGLGGGSCAMYYVPPDRRPLGGAASPAGNDGAQRAEHERRRRLAIGPSCYDSNKFSALFGGGTASRIVDAVGTGSAVSFGSDVIATGLKALKGGVGGPKGPYASGINMVGKAVVRVGGRALNLSPGAIGRGVGVVGKIGDKVTPTLAVIGVFTLVYNTTIDIQCRLDVIE